MIANFLKFSYNMSCKIVPVAVNLVVLLPPRLLLHVTSTVLVEVTVIFDVSVTVEVSTLHRTEVYTGKE